MNFEANDKEVLFFLSNNLPISSNLTEAELVEHLKKMDDWEETSNTYCLPHLNAGDVNISPRISFSDGLIYEVVLEFRLSSESEDPWFDASSETYELLYEKVRTWLHQAKLREKEYDWGFVTLRNSKGREQGIITTL